MPLISSAMSTLMLLKSSQKFMSGSKLPFIVSAVSNATSQYVIVASIVNSTNNALGPGSGTQTGRIVGLFPPVMSGLMVAKAASFGIAGRDSKKLFDAVSFGVVNAMKTVLLQGAIIGAGPGTGRGRIKGLIPDILEGSIMAQEYFKQISGDKLRYIVKAMAFGICNHIKKTGTVIVTNIGVAASPPVGPVTIPAAPGIGKLV